MGYLSGGLWYGWHLASQVCTGENSGLSHGPSPIDRPGNRTIKDPGGRTKVHERVTHVIGHQESLLKWHEGSRTLSAIKKVYSNGTKVRARYRPSRKSTQMARRFAHVIGHQESLLKWHEGSRTLSAIIFKKVQERLFSQMYIENNQKRYKHPHPPGFLLRNRAEIITIHLL